MLFNDINGRCRVCGEVVCKTQHQVSERLTVRIVSTIKDPVFEDGVEVSFEEDSELFQTVKRFYIRLLEMVRTERNIQHDNK